MKASLGVILLFAGACGPGNPSNPKDGSVDVTNIDSGPCPSTKFFTGELVDWDSSDTAFCGVFNAKFEVAGDPTRTDMTNPNGRFQICLADAATTRVDITPPTAQSECTNPPSTYGLPGIAVADASVLAAGQFFSMRMFTMDRTNSLGVVLDPTKAHVFVHIDLTPQPVQISAVHGVTMFWDGTSWNSTGPTGVNVFFPNATVGSGTTNVTMTGGAIGAGSVPIEAGKITYVTLVGS